METTEVFSSTLHPPIDIDDSRDFGCSLYHIGIRIILGGLLVLFGLFGNGVTVVVIRKKMKKSNTYLTLFYLVIADSLLLCIYGSMSLVRPTLDLLGLKSESKQMHVIGILCLSAAGQTVNQIIVMLTTLLTWQRYTSVCQPHRAKVYTSEKVTKWLAFASVITSIAVNIPSYCQADIRTDADGDLVISYKAFAKSEAYLLAESIFFLLVSYVLPVGALVFMATSLALSLRKKVAPAEMQSAAHSTATIKAKNDLTVLVIIVAIVFIVCQSLSPTRKVLMWVYKPYNVALRCGNPLFHFGPLYLISFLVNSACNFIVFCSCAKGFRRYVRVLFCGSSNVVVPVSSSTEATNTP